MSGRRDLELLRASNPVNPQDLPGPGSPEVRQVLSRVTSHPRPEAPAPVPWRSRPVLAYAVLVLILGAGAWLWTSSIRQADAIACYEEDSLDANRVAAPPIGTATPDACAPMWESGYLTNPSVPVGSIPPLTACVSEAGGLAVFPTDDPGICVRLGLSRPDPAGQDQADDQAALLVRLLEIFESEDCLLIPDADSAVRRVLDESGYESWAVVVGSTDPENPCGTLGFDPQGQTVHIVPGPPPD